MKQRPEDLVEVRVRDGQAPHDPWGRADGLTQPRPSPHFTASPSANQMRGSADLNGFESAIRTVRPQAAFLIKAEPRAARPRSPHRPVVEIVSYQGAECEAGPAISQVAALPIGPPMPRVYLTNSALLSRPKTISVCRITSGRKYFSRN